MVLHHACCVELDGAGVLIFGESGAGKSDLALRLIYGGAVLVADDCVETRQEGTDGALVAFAPENICGLMEVRGLGVVKMPYKEKTTVKLKVYLSSFDKIDRMPSEVEPALLAGRILEIRINAFESAAVEKIKTALAVVDGKIGLAQ